MRAARTRDRCAGREADRALTSTSAERLIDTAEANGRILQVGHLERFNPAVQAVQQKVTLPLFFEIHRMSMFSPRSLDVDVVLDLMIHDIDVVLALTRPRTGGDSGRRHSYPVGQSRYRERPAGFSWRMRREPDSQPGIDGKDPQNTIVPAASIYFARLSAAGCELRSLFFRTGKLGLIRFAVVKGEPLQFEIERSWHASEPASKPVVTGEDGTKALRVALCNSC